MLVHLRCSNRAGPQRLAPRGTHSPVAVCDRGPSWCQARAQRSGCGVPEGWPRGGRPADGGGGGGFGREPEQVQRGRRGSRSRRVSSLGSDDSFPL